jgi:hypothetical protein
MNQEPTHIDATIAALEGWLERISTAIGTLKYFRAQGGSLPDMPPLAGVRASSNGDISHDTFFKMTVPDAAEKYFKLAKKTKTTSEIAAALLNGGLKSASKNFSAMVKTVLARDARFVKVNKEWGLDDWYPGIRRGNRSATADTSVDSKPSDVPVKKPSRDEHKKEGIGPDSVKGRTLALLNSKSGELFTAKKVAEAMGQGQHLPSVRAALCALLADQLIARPKTGEYQSLKG